MTSTPDNIDPDEGSADSGGPRDGDGSEAAYDQKMWEQIVADLGDDPAIPSSRALDPPVAYTEDDTFIPPDPPATPTDTVGKAAWATLAAGPALLLASALLGSPGLLALGFACLVVGSVMLVMRSPRPPREGWEDGSEV